MLPSLASSKSSPAKLWFDVNLHNFAPIFPILYVRESKHSRSLPIQKLYKCHAGLIYSYIIFWFRFHLKLREVPCTLCDKMFIDEAASRKHLKTVHFKVKNFHCPHCDKSFSQRNKLTYHVRTHSGEKPFSCTECGRSFSLLWNLKTHLRTHTGEKPYACDVCGRKFTQKQNMTSHMTTHKKPKMARSNSYVNFSNSDNLDYFSMSELRQSGKATMVGYRLHFSFLWY